VVDKKVVNKILKIYREAWVNQDVDKLLSVFAKDGIYHEKVLEKPFIGHKEIKAYWQRKVIEEQSHIKFRLLNVYVDDDTVIAEWDASFYSSIKKARIHIREVAILEIDKNKIKSLREYWRSEKTSSTK